MSRLKAGDRIYFDMFVGVDGRQGPCIEYPGTVIEQDPKSSYWLVEWDDGKFGGEYWPEEVLFLQSDYS